MKRQFTAGKIHFKQATGCDSAVGKHYALLHGNQTSNCLSGSSLSLFLPYNPRFILGHPRQSATLPNIHLSGLAVGSALCIRKVARNTRRETKKITYGYTGHYPSQHAFSNIVLSLLSCKARPLFDQINMLGPSMCLPPSSTLRTVIYWAQDLPSHHLRFISIRLFRSPRPTTFAPRPKQDLSSSQPSCSSS
jgi:hypothetical protein